MKILGRKVCNSMIDKKQVKLHFSKNASNYDNYAKVQKKMSNDLVEFLRQSVDSPLKVTKILEIGCGTGCLTNILLKLFPFSHITAVDIAQGMIIEAKARLHNNSSVDFVCGDIEEMELKDTYDIIISNATFQWFNDTEPTIQKLHASLNPGGILCFSTFGSETFNELNKSFKEASKIHSFDEPVASGQFFYSLEELKSLCKNSLNPKELIFESSVSGKEYLEYEYFNNCRDFFQSIKKIGANNSNKNNRFSSPAFIKSVIKFYDNNFKVNNKIQATYHCLFLKITKKCP